MLTINRWIRGVERLICMFEDDIPLSAHLSDIFPCSAILRIIHELENCSSPDKVNK